VRLSTHTARPQTSLNGRYSVRPTSGCLWMVFGDTCDTGHLRNFRFEAVEGRRHRRMPTASLHPGHEDSVQLMEDGLLGTPRRPGVHLRQWVAPSSTRVSPITPERQFQLHFFGNRGIRLLRTDVRRPGTTPVSRALPRALAWSTILYRSPHTGSPSLYSWAGRHLGHRENPQAERRTICPSSDGSTHGQDGSCSKDRRDCQSPWTTL
jgi:hypothetical protein